MSKTFKRLSHSIYECKYYVVFCPKYRYHIFQDDMAEYTRQHVYQLCRQKDAVEVLDRIVTFHPFLPTSMPA